MALPVWGNLEKSQIDSEKIEKAIARLIQAHEDDPDSHVEIGESLYSHKAAEIIDHIVASIIADKIKDGEITTAKLNNLAVTEAKIGSLAVTEAKIGSLAVTTLKIGGLAITEAKIGSLAVTEAKIGNQAVATDKLKNLAVTNAKIANATIETAKIKDLQVTNAKIANATITDAKITDLTVEKLTGTYLTGKTVRTAVSGKRVEMRGANNDIAFYDASGNLGGIILGQSGKIYISGGDLNVETKLWVEDEFIPDTCRHLIPTNSSYYLGSASYHWGRVICDNLYHGSTRITDLSGGNFDMYVPIILNTLASDPAGVLGKIFYHTGTKKIRIYGGDPPAWRDIAFA